MIELGVVDYVLKKNISAYEYACHLAQRVHRNHSTKVLIVDDSKSALLMLKRHL
jgi:PleD family two-component response regulator